MEASGAGLAAGSDGADGTQQDGQQGDAGTGPDAALSQLGEQLATLSAGQEEMRAFLSGIAEQQEGPSEGQEEQQQPEVPDLSFLETEQDQAKAAEALQQIMRSEAGSETQKLLQEALTPLQQEVADMRRSQETDALVAKYQDLGDPKVAEAVVGAAGQWAEALGKPELATNVGFLEMTYLAGRAAELAQRQGNAADGGGATLEGAGGASPGGAGQGADVAGELAEKWGSGNNVLSKL